VWKRHVIRLTRRLGSCAIKLDRLLWIKKERTQSFLIHESNKQNKTKLANRKHSLANRHSCSTPAEKRVRKCFSMQLIFVVGKADMINQICQMLSFC